MAKSKKQQAAIAVSMKKQGKVPAGYHKMPDGKIMKDSAHKKPKMQSGGPIDESIDYKKMPEIKITAPKPTAFERVKGEVNKILRKITKPTETAVPKPITTKPVMKKGGAVKMKMGGTMKKKK